MMNENQAQAAALLRIEAMLGVNARGMVALLDGVTYGVYGKWRRGETLMNESAKVAISMLLCMHQAKQLNVPAFDLWKQASGKNIGWSV